MSTNCIVCVKNKRTGFDLLCDDCRVTEAQRVAAISDSRPSTGSAILSASPRPWKVHRTGDKLSITDACGKFVFRKVVSTLRGGVPEYDRLLADFTAIAEAVNAHWPNGALSSGGEALNE